MRAQVLNWQRESDGRQHFEHYIPKKHICQKIIAENIFTGKASLMGASAELIERLQLAKYNGYTFFRRRNLRKKESIHLTNNQKTQNVEVDIMWTF